MVCCVEYAGKEVAKMGRVLHGRILGRSIALDEDPKMPEGTPVVVDVSRQPEPEKRFRDLCGAWRGDPTIPKVFEEIQAARQKHTTTPVQTG